MAGEVPEALEELREKAQHEQADGGVSVCCNTLEKVLGDFGWALREMVSYDSFIKDLL